MIRSMFGKSALTLLVLSSLSLAPIAATADDDDDDRNKNSFKASLQSFQEVPAVSSAAFGKFKATHDSAAASINWELSYEGISPTQSHIHFAQKGVNGGIMVFLCTNLGNGPAGTQPCPAGPGPVKIMGSFTGANMVNSAAGQGIPAGAFDKLLQALRGSIAYVNVHTTTFPGGEIRGQVK